jgi:histidinol-phosphate aminotransferase
MELNKSSIKEYLLDLQLPIYLKEEPEKDYVDCCLGINPYGCSPKVEEKLESLSDDNVDLHKYPDRGYSDLKTAIASKWSGKIDCSVKGRVRVGNGAKRIMENINYMVLDENSKVVGFQPQYLGYIRMVKAANAEYDPVDLDPKRGFKIDVTRLVNKIKEEKPDIVFVDNPNNPTGQFLPLDKVEEIIEEAEKQGTIALIDEAYHSFLERDKSAATLVEDYDNLVVVRSFSKAHGLAGQRVGYCILSSRLAQIYDKVAPSFQVSRIGATLAKEALRQEEHIKNCREKILKEKKKVLNEVDYFVPETHEKVPIFLVGSRSVENMHQEMLDKGILTTACGDFRNLGKNYARVSLPKSTGELVKKLKKSKKKKVEKIGRASE